MNPITTDACTLPTAERPMRVAEFDALFAEAVVGVERAGDDVRLNLSGSAGLTERVRDLTHRESMCCTFFSFTLSGSDDDLSLVISVPPEHRGVLDAITARAAGRRAS